MKITKSKKKYVEFGITCLIFISLGVSFYYLSVLKRQSINETPFKWLNIDKPTLIFVFSEDECASCVKGLHFLNSLYPELKEKGDIELLGVILSKTGSDKKGISRFFQFPFIITHHFDFMKRFNTRRTPIVIGLSKEKELLHFDLIPAETGITDEFLRSGVLDRLYYSLGW
jgi:hypothetical protein